ncbi:MAG: hypothetical protein BGN86_04555 [Caulobacterales bacterium 68-7]|nr:MAG: hypothetical protein BGN86_04555 [Caulobacterales bacterium 68-7]
MPLVDRAWMRTALRRGAIGALTLATLGLTACGAVSKINPFDGGGTRTVAAASAGDAALGVNAYLWRASLDTFAFIPLVSADPYGGVIITDWYVNPEKPDERFKVTIYILDTRLRADGLNITVFKQNRGAGGAWVDAPVTDQTEVDLENAVLTRARQLRLSNIGS